MRTFFVRLLVCLVLAPQAFAQVVLQKSADLPDRYIVEFFPMEAIADRIKEQKNEAIKILREQQNLRLGQLTNDLQGTDLMVLRDLWIKQSVAISISARFLDRIRDLHYVKQVRVDPQYRAEPLGVVTLPKSGELAQDNLARVDVDALWQEEYRGQGVVVAILDSGVDPLHEDLVNRWRGGTNSWFDPYQQQPEPKDLTGHGTAVSSIVLGGDATGSHIGVAPQAQWIGARIFDNNGSASESAISEVMQWIVDPDGNPATDDFPDIMQNSWGLVGTEGSCINPFATELAVIDALGIDVVFAVGNSGLSGPGVGGFSSYLTPAFDSHAISVGALGTTDVLLFSSSRGPDRCGSPVIVIPSVVAPGEFIRSADLTFDGFDSDNVTANTGTSFSTPHVSGVLALLRSKYRASSHLQYRTAMFNTAALIGSQNDYGRGLVKASAAATSLQNQSIPSRPSEVSFSMAVYQVDEGIVTATISVIRSGDIDSAVSVDISSADGSAIKIDDYQAVSATLNFEAGEGSKRVDIEIIDDIDREADEVFSLVLSNNIGVNLGSKSTQTITIRDDDGPVEEEDEIGGGSSGILGLLFLVLICAARRASR